MKSTILAVFLFLCFSLLLVSENVSAQGIEPEQIASVKLKQIIITPHMEENISFGKNVLYCSTFQIAWNMLQNDIIKEDILLDGDPLMVRLLNKQLSTKSDISEECYVAMADKLTESFLQRINNALKEKFGDQASPEVKEHIIPELPQIFSYAYMHKSLQFTKKFESFERLIFRSNEVETKVKAFGIERYSYEEKHREMGKQVSVIDYTYEDDFIISLKSKSANDEIILAKVEPKETLLSTILAVSKRIKQSTPSSLREDDILQIPKFDFNLKHSFSELEEKYFKNKRWEEWYISKAIQWIRFKLSEKGAILKSEARIVMIPMNGEPRKLIFNKPFLIYLRQKDGEYPYFAMWLDNAELLIKEESRTLQLRQE